MHYYQFNIADYRKDTGHLTPIEHYIYRTLMDWYYLDEAPIPKITQTVSRRLCLVSDDEQSLLNVLNDFFVLGDEGWSHGRIDREIDIYHAKASTNRINGKKGGRPKNQQVTDYTKPKITQSVNFANPSESESNPNHKPLTINHKPEEKEKIKRFSPPTLSELSEHLREKQYTFDPETFIAHYESNDWRVGKNKMKCWKSACTTWQKREAKPNEGHKSAYQQRVEESDRSTFDLTKDFQ